MMISSKPKFQSFQNDNQNTGVRKNTSYLYMNNNITNRSNQKLSNKDKKLQNTNRNASKDSFNELLSDRFIPLRRGDVTKQFYDTCLSRDSSVNSEKSINNDDSKKSNKILKDILRDNILSSNLGYDSLGSRQDYYKEKQFFYEKNCSKNNKLDNTKESSKKRSEEVKNSQQNSSQKLRKFNPLLQYKMHISDYEQFVNLSDESTFGKKKSNFGTKNYTTSNYPKIDAKSYKNSQHKSYNCYNNKGNTNSEDLFENISTVPYKTLEAPGLEDDFYLNLLDWTYKNQICIAQNEGVYMWDYSTKQIEQLCKFQDCCSQKASPNGENLAIGSLWGNIEVWNSADFEQKTKLANVDCHNGRVGIVKWLDNNCFMSGSRDGVLVQTDLRVGKPIKKLFGHAQEICGLSINELDNNKIATGGNDNKMILWDQRSNEPEKVLKQHKAAIKALAWNPHERGMIYSGGGNNDKTIKCYNQITQTEGKTQNVESQVTGIIFSKFSSSFVSCHGYVTNHLALWQLPNSAPSLKLRGHESRIQYYAQSPDGEDIVTGAGDETIRFWKVFKQKNKKSLYSSLPNTLEIR